MPISCKRYGAHLLGALLLLAPAAQAAGVLARYSDYRERVFDQHGQLQYQLATREYLQRIPDGHPSLSHLFALRSWQRDALQLRQGTLRVKVATVNFQHGYYQDGQLMMSGTEVTLPEGRLHATSLRFDPVHQVLDAPRAMLLSPTGDVLGNYRNYRRPLH
ncbi:MAG: hypothetical protein RR721_14385 [Aeromonas sp.]|uniref:hypothetical protein n=1 Tax=Aeromonas sp. TaxID=647 RepID=UPI002FC8C18E